MIETWVLWGVKISHQSSTQEQCIMYSKGSGPSNKREQ